MPSLASGLQRCSPCERLLGLLRPLPCWVSSPCVFPLQQRKHADGIEKAYHTGYSGHTAGCEHGFCGMQPSSTTWADDYRGHQAKGKLQRDHSWFTSLEANDVALQRSTLFWRHCWRIMGFQRQCWANSFTLCHLCPTQWYVWCKKPRTCWQQTCKAHSKLFLDDGICPDHTARAPACTSDAFLPDYFQRSGSLCQIRSGTDSMQRRRWVSMDPSSAQLDCLPHALGAAVSKTCSQTFGIAVFIEVLCKLGGWYALPGYMPWLPNNVWPWPATWKSAEGNIFQLSSR